MKMFTFKIKLKGKFIDMEKLIPKQQNSIICVISAINMVKTFYFGN